MPGAARDHSDERLTQALLELADVQLELDRERLRRVEVEGMFDEVLGSMSDALILVDPRGHIWRANEAAARLLGADLDAVVGEQFGALAGPRLPVSPWEMFERDASGLISAYETEVVRRDGSAVPISLSCSVIRDPSGKVAGAVYLARDLSETVLLLRQIEEAEARWRLLAEVGDILSGEIDPAAALPKVCELVAAATGASVIALVVQDQVIANAAAWNARVPVDDAAAAMLGRPVPAGTALARAISERQVVHAPRLSPTFPLMTPGGEGAQVGSAAVLPMTAKGSSVGALVLLTPEPDGVTPDAVDRTEQVALRIGLALSLARLRASLTELEAAREAARSREDIIAGLSHDMKTPLAVITSLVKALRLHEAEMDQERRSGVHDALWRQSVRLRSLVQQFLDYSRLESGHALLVRMRPTDVARVIEQVLKTWGPQAPIEVRIDGAIPPVEADPDRAEQILANLVSNAVKFSDPGTPILIEAVPNDDTVDIAVVDHGWGIPPADLAVLFTKFQRGTLARGTEGTGLGLYICRALAEAQGGRLSVTSRPGAGSRFTLSLSRTRTLATP